MDIEMLAEEVLARLRAARIGTVITVRAGGELLIEEPGGPPLSGSDRRGELAVFVVTTMPPGRREVVARLRSGVARSER